MTNTHGIMNCGCYHHLYYNYVTFISLDEFQAIFLKFKNLIYKILFIYDSR
jgi:hypothetical protein